jgi:hypothetical protein
MSKPQKAKSQTGSKSGSQPTSGASIGKMGAQLGKEGRRVGMRSIRKLTLDPPRKLASGPITSQLPTGAISPKEWLK